MRVTGNGPHASLTLSSSMDGEREPKRYPAPTKDGKEGGGGDGGRTLLLTVVIVVVVVVLDNRCCRKSEKHYRCFVLVLILMHVVLPCQL